MNSARAVAILALLVLSGAAFSRVPAELNAFGMQLQSPVQMTHNLQASRGEQPLPWSERGRSYLLKACLDLQVSQALAFYPQADRDAVRESCLRLADRVMAQNPSYGLAALVRAQSVPLDRRTDAVKAAQVRAPHEGWMAIWRLLTVFRDGPPSDARINDLVVQDIAVLRTSYAQTRILAGYYLRFPTWRDVIIAGLSDAPQVTQDQFYGLVRQRLTGGN